MKVSFVAGFGPIVRETDASLAFWRDAIGLPMSEIAPGYWGTDDVQGVKAFAAWPLSQAAESTFGTDAWPSDLPVPQAWLELDVELSMHRIDPFGQAHELEPAFVQIDLAAGTHNFRRGVAVDGPVGPDHVPHPHRGGPAAGHHLHPLDARGQRRRGAGRHH